MGLIWAAVGAIGGTFGDQWKDFYTVPEDISPTAAVFPAFKAGTNAGRGSNTSSSVSVVTNGSKFVVPEGFGLVLMEDGAFTGYVTEPGGYIWDSESQDSKSIFAGSGFVDSLVKTTWDRFKFGGRPQSQQMAIFVSLKELPNNKFGTASAIYWDDSYLRTQAGANVRGTYTLRIVDPLLFIKQFVPTKYLQTGQIFDFTDLNNGQAHQLFDEVVGSLSSAFAQYANEPEKHNRISSLQQDSLGFSKTLASVVDSNYGWKASRGLEIVRTAIVGIDYDDETRDLLKTVQRADSLVGSRGNSNLQASVAAGIQAAGSIEGSAGILGLGIASNSIGLGGFVQQDTASTGSAESDLQTKLRQLRQLFDEGLISQVEFDAAKAKALGL